MQDDEPPVARLLEVAASTAPLLERARDLVESLDRWLLVEAIWLTLSDPESNAYATVGRSGLEQPVLEFLDGPSLAREIKLTQLNVNRPPISVTELPVPVDELPTWADCLIPAGFRGGLSLPLFEPGGPSLGMLSLLFSRAAPPSDEMRDRVGKLVPLIARAVSPVRSLLASARLAQGATSGVVLLRDGSTYPLPGLRDDTLLDANSFIVRQARHTLRAGQVYRSFLWPTKDASHPRSHVRVTVLAATDVPPFMLGTVLLTVEADCRGLTPRELVVLGLLVDGRSNHDIAQNLVIAPRTVATHVEHILDKLDVPTRTLAAVRAEREGCYVPASRPSG
jgi:DNA-binding CsgD family transcriptional regulator